jgi:hypothetical protein
VTAGIEDSRTAWRVSGGWTFNQFMAAEVGYSDLRPVSTSYAGTIPLLAVDAFLEEAVRLHPRTADGFDVSVVGRYPLRFAPRFSVQARAGAFRWEAERSVTASDGRTAIRKDDGMDLLLGAGLAYAMSSRTDVMAEWMRYALEGESVQALSVGVRYRW